MKTVSVTEFRNNLKHYLDMAHDEKIVIHRNTGKSFILVPLEEKDENTIISNNQKKAIDNALESVEKGKTFSNEKVQKKLSSIHPKYFK